VDPQTLGSWTEADRALAGKLLRGEADPEAALWRAGELRYLLREHGQRRVYDKTHAWKLENPKKYGPIVWEEHRRFGKSFAGTLYGVERCKRYPRQIVRYGAPSLTQCEEIVRPIMQEILWRCPEDQRPQPKGNTWIFPHPGGRDSVFMLIGCREEAFNHRGKASDVIILDECRDIENFETVVNVVFGFHFVGRHLPTMILMGTPPDLMDHPFIQQFIPAAIANKTYFLETVETNEDWSPEDEEEIVKICGSKGSIAWRREALCEHISDPKGLIVPEFVELEHRGILPTVVVEEHPRPSHFYPFTCMDGGFSDYTGVLFGYIDFPTAHDGEKLLVIEDELWDRQLNSAQWKAKILEKEAELYAKAAHPVTRIGDLTSKQSRVDLAQVLHFPVLEVKKFDKDSAVAALRSTIQNLKIRIFSRCEHLTYQLRNGVYAKNRVDFIRTETLGHCDLIDALVYLHRHAYWNANPYPIRGYQFMDTFIPAEDDQPDTLRVLEEEDVRL